MKHTLPDHAIAIAKAALNLVPVVGGPIASLISDYVPSSAQRATERGVHILVERLAALEERLDIEGVNKEDFAELFTNYWLVINRTNREEKLSAAANLLANLLLRANDAGKSPYEELDHLMHCVETLSIGAICALGAARSMQGTTMNNARFDFPTLRRQIPNLEASLLMSLVSELRSLNLVKVAEGDIGTSDYEHISIELTPIGLRFAERFIEGKM